MRVLPGQKRWWNADADSRVIGAPGGWALRMTDLIGQASVNALRALFPAGFARLRASPAARAVPGPRNAFCTAEALVTTL
jgi:hypothetical protein